MSEAPTLGLGAPDWVRFITRRLWTDIGISDFSLGVAGALFPGWRNASEAEAEARDFVALFHKILTERPRERIPHPSARLSEIALAARRIWARMPGAAVVLRPLKAACTSTTNACAFCHATSRLKSPMTSSFGHHGRWPPQDHHQSNARSYSKSPKLKSEIPMSVHSRRVINRTQSGAPRPRVGALTSGLAHLALHLARSSRQQTRRAPSCPFLLTRAVKTP
jgi:hypothetical protein